MLRCPFREAIMRSSKIRFRVFAFLVLVAVAGPGPVPRGSVRCNARLPGLSCRPIARRVGSVPRIGNSTPLVAKLPRVGVPSLRRVSGLRMTTGLVRPGVLANLPHREAPPEVVPGLESLERHARFLAWSRLSQAARDLRRDPRLTGELRTTVEEIERRARLLAAWQSLRLMVHGSWESAPDAKTVQHTLDGVQASAGKGTRDRLAHAASRKRPPDRCSGRVARLETIDRGSTPEGTNPSAARSPDYSAVARSSGDELPPGRPGIAAR
jgi:hypothetical protein